MRHNPLPQIHEFPWTALCAQVQKEIGKLGINGAVVPHLVLAMLALRTDPDVSPEQRQLLWNEFGQWLNDTIEDAEIAGLVTILPPKPPGDVRQN
jgi:hypothetical protein